MGLIIQSVVYSYNVFALIKRFIDSCDTETSFTPFDLG